MPHSSQLSVKQILILALYGALLWFVAAMLVRVAGPGGALDGRWLMLTYVLVIPGTVPAVMMARWLVGLARGQLVPGVAIATAAAALLDGVALASVPRLYGNDVEHVLGGAALILWGVGVGLAVAWVMERR